MPTPNATLSTHRPDLASFLEYDTEASFQGLVGAQVFPFHAVGEVAGNFGRVTLESLSKTIATERSPGGPYNRSKWEFETDTYACEEHGQEEPIDDREAKMYQNYFTAETISVVRARNSVLTNHELRVQAILDTARSQDTNGSDWTSAANGTPVDDVDTAVRALYARGIVANAIVMSWLSFRNAIRTDQVVSLLEGSGSGSPAHPGSIDAPRLASVLNIDRVIVAAKQQNTNLAPGSNTLSPIWAEDTAYVTRVAETEDVREPCCGRTFHYEEDGSEEGGRVEQYRDETVRSEIYRCRMDTDEKLMYAESIQRLTSIDA
jgi:hypothetical protein